MSVTRRELLKNAALGGIVSSFLPLIPIHAETKKAVVNRALRIAHITDVHILDQKNAEASFARVMAELNAMKDKPDLIINTGDTVMDENKQTKETVATRWGMWQKIIQSNKIKMQSALGNHDVWYGPDETLDTEYKKEKRYGKQWGHGNAFDARSILLFRNEGLAFYCTRQH
ncbi:MAG: metallophosphoesterase [Bacteroidota bacterium]